MNISMNSAMSVTLPTSGEPAAASSPAPVDGLPLAPALAGVQAAANPLAFLQFLQLDTAAPPAQADAPEEAPALPEAQHAEAPGQQPAASEAAQEDVLDPSLLAVMTMPLMPSMMAMPAALPAAVRASAGMPEQPRAADTAPVAAATAAPTELSLTALARAAAPTELPLTALARASVPAEQLQQSAPQPALPAPRGEAAAQPARAAPATPAAPAAAASQPAAPQAEHAGTDVQASGGAGFTVAAPAPGAAPRETSTVTLVGPPTAWRQTLQEALGERLNLQIGKNAEQAVIRLEPPMLGRVEISIRHAAGSLEVNITATHGEVLRQLNTVSENLRNDLAGRQYSDVSVNVSQAPRAQAMAQSGAGFNADAQGRGRQQEQGQDTQPGAALAEAHQPNAAFSLSGRA